MNKWSLWETKYHKSEIKYVADESVCFPSFDKWQLLVGDEDSLLRDTVSHTVQTALDCPANKLKWAGYGAAASPQTLWF